MRASEDKWLEKVSNYSVVNILLIIAIIILITPWLFTLPVINERFNLTSTGSIGDTIGGITSPFLNGLAALLVFIAFKAQINANKIFKNQSDYNSISDYLNRIEDDNFNINTILKGVKDKSIQIHNNNPFPQEDYIALLNKTQFITTKFSVGLDLIDKFDGDKKLLWKRLYFLYVILYKDALILIAKEMEAVVNKTEYSQYKYEIIGQVNKLNKEIMDVNKY